jgi:non-ribosomal peptide synthetase component F
MSPREIFALRDHLGAELTGRTLSDAHDVVSLTDILSQTVLGGRLGELSGRAVLLKLSDQLRSGLAMIELDGIARRMLLCPPDLNPAHLDALMANAGIDAVVTDEPDRWAETGVPLVVTAQLPLQATAPARTERATEWLMLTSGTSGVPKIVGHTLEALTGAIVAEGPARGPAPVWATFYDIRRYGGLQIFLRAVLSGGSMVLSDPHVERARRLPHLRHALALAQAVDERLGRAVRAALCPPLRRDRRPGGAGRPESGVPEFLRRPCLCVNRGRRRLCRQ